MENVIAIDGPSGSGKSTMAKKLASTLGVLYIDTGAMFRALACHMKGQSIDLFDEVALEAALSKVCIEYGKDSTTLIAIDGVDYTQKIRVHAVSRYASQISQVSVVRDYLLGFQRDLARQSVCVMEGRDIGSVVFPHAFCKIFVTASPQVRAKRRLKQLQELGDNNQTLEQVLNDVIKRDKIDSEREVAPLIVANGAKVFDTSELDQDRVLDLMVELVKKKAELENISLV